MKPGTVSAATWLGYLALCLGMFMAILDIQIVASSLPTLREALHIKPTDLSWIQTAYLIAEIVAIPLTGWLTRLLSLRWLFIAAVTGFTAASIGCAASNHFEMLLVFRVLQGFCGGALIPVVFTSVFVLFPKRLHIMATTIGGLFAMLAPTIGPVLGGYITESYSWHWLFLINVPSGIIVVIVASFCLSTGKPEWSLWRQLDALSLLLIVLCLASLEILLKEGPSHHWYGSYILLLLLVCPLTGAVAVRRCLSRSEPVLDVRRFADRQFVIGCLYSFVLGMGLFGSVYLMPLYLGFVREHSAFEIGKIMVVMGATQLVVAPFAALAEKRVPAKWLVVFGYSLFAGGLIINGFLTPRSDFHELFWPQILRGAAVLFCLLPTTALALEQQTATHLANASGLFNLMRNLGGAIAIAVIDTLLEQRTPIHAEHIETQLQAGDRTTASMVGLPLSHFHGMPLGPVDQDAKDLFAPLVKKAALVMSFNEAWLILGGIFAFAALLAIIVVSKSSDEETQQQEGR